MKRSREELLKILGGMCESRTKKLTHNMAKFSIVQWINLTKIRNFILFENKTFQVFLYIYLAFI